MLYSLPVPVQEKKNAKCLTPLLYSKSLKKIPLFILKKNPETEKKITKGCDLVAVQLITNPQTKSFFL